MEFTLKEKASKALFSKACDLSFKAIKKDPVKGMEEITSVIDKFLMPKSSKENSAKMAIGKIRNEFANPNSKWTSFAEDMVNDVDSHILNQFAVTVGYNAFYRGNAIRNKLQEEYDCNIPWTILFDPTSACNLKCLGCWAAEYGYKNNLTYDEMASIVRQANDLGSYFFIMTGGEPLVRKDDIIKLAEEFNDSAFHIFTNGTLIDEEFCKEVRRVGNISFALSIEGSEESTDARRGDGVYQKVMDALSLMKENKLLYGISVCYTSANYKQVTSDEFMEKMVDKGCKIAWFFHYMPVGNDADVSLLPNPSQREYVYKRVREIRSSSSPHNIYTIDFQNDGEYIRGCIAGGKNYFHINSQGDMEPCVFIHYSDSNIREKTILEALQSPLFMAYHRNQPFNDNMLKPCPMLENAGKLTKMVKETNAKSTDLISPENVEDLEAKCRPYAKEWNKEANRLWQERLLEKEKLKEAEKENIKA